MKKIAQAIVLCCLFLSILEITSRALLYVKPIDRIIRQHPNSAIVRRWVWIEKHQPGRPPVVPYDRYDPSRGWALKPDLSCKGVWGGGQNQILCSNSKGLRDRTEYSYARNKKPRILCLGDSFTFGEEVSDKETFPYYLQQLLPDAEVINMGVHGYGHDQMLIYLREEGVKYHPDMVLLGFLSQDSDRNMTAFGDYAKPRFKLVKSRLKLCNVPVPTPEATLREAPWRSRFWELLYYLRERISEWTGAYDQEKEAVTDAILKEIIKTTRSIGAVPVFVYLDRAPEMPALEDLNEEKRFLDKCGELSVKCVFLGHEVFFNKNTEIKNKKDHYDPETNQRIALGIKNDLLKNSYLTEKGQNDGPMAFKRDFSFKNETPREISRGLNNAQLPQKNIL